MSGELVITINYFGNNLRLKIKQEEEKYIRAATKELNEKFFTLTNSANSALSIDVVLKKMLLEAATKLKMAEEYVYMSKDAFDQLVNAEKKLEQHLH